MKDKFNETYKNIIKQDQAKFLKETEFPQEVKDAIKKLLDLNEKVKKRNEQRDKLDKQIRDLGETLNKHNDTLIKSGRGNIPNKYLKLAWDVLEALH